MYIEHWELILKWQMVCIHTCVNGIFNARLITGTQHVY